jgi:hypothetical protein
MFPRLIKKRSLQPGLPTQLHSLMSSTIIVPAAHYVCSAVCSIFVVTVRGITSWEGKRAGGRRVTALTTIAEPMSQGLVPGSEFV